MTDINLEPPSIEEELNRKAVDELLRITTMLDDGIITVAEYKACIDTLFNTVSGLADGDFFDMITEAGRGIDDSDKSFFRTTQMTKGEKRVVVSWNILGRNVIIETANVVVGDAKTIELANESMPKDVLAKVNKIKKKFTDAGYAV